MLYPTTSEYIVVPFWLINVKKPGYLSFLTSLWSIFVKRGKLSAFEVKLTSAYVIDEKTIVLKISDNETYNYKLEFRQKGLVIKPLDNSSGYFANLNKSVVIKSAITEIKNIAGYLKNQIKTIIFDLANKL